MRPEIINPKIINPWLHIIGISEGGISFLSQEAQALLSQAEFVFGSERLLGYVAPYIKDAQMHPWSRPWPEACAQISDLQGRFVIVLATGDPSWFGPARSFIRRFGKDQVTIYPMVGSFSLAAARLGWALEDCLCTSIHGRPLTSIIPDIYPPMKLLILGHDADSAVQIALLLRRDSRLRAVMTILENLGSTSEQILTYDLNDFIPEHHPFATIALEISKNSVPSTAADHFSFYSRMAGLPDAAFEHDRQLTKQWLRALTLATMSSHYGGVLWDIGSGSGSIAIEWSRQKGLAYAVEKNRTRCEFIKSNANRLGATSLHLLEGIAPHTLPDLSPDVIFIGGGSSDITLLTTCWKRLKPGGLLVINSVSIEAEQVLLNFSRQHGGHLNRYSKESIQPLGHLNRWQAGASITQYRHEKP